MTNNTLLNANSTQPPVPHDSSTGLAVGLTLLLLFVVVAVALAYKWRSKIMTTMQFGKKRQQKNLEVDVADVPQAASHRYSSLDRQQSTGQQPIYENLTAQTSGYKEHPANTVSEKRLTGEQQEDLYLQCDPEADAIYSNDLVGDLSNLPDLGGEEEDVYIVPDTL